MRDHLYPFYFDKYCHWQCFAATSSAEKNCVLCEAKEKCQAWLESGKGSVWCLVALPMALPSWSASTTQLHMPGPGMTKLFDFGQSSEYMWLFVVIALPRLYFVVYLYFEGTACWELKLLVGSHCLNYLRFLSYSFCLLYLMLIE